jgi:hypothetical protein
MLVVTLDDIENEEARANESFANWLNTDTDFHRLSSRAKAMLIDYVQGQTREKADYQSDLHRPSWCTNGAVKPSVPKEWDTELPLSGDTLCVIWHDDDYCFAWWIEGTNCWDSPVHGFLAKETVYQWYAMPENEPN